MRFKRMNEQQPSQNNRYYTLYQQSQLFKSLVGRKYIINRR